jgi:hypothetical protein
MAVVAYRIPCNAQSHANDHRARYRRRGIRSARNAAYEGRDRGGESRSEPGVTSPPSAAVPNRADEPERTAPPQPAPAMRTNTNTNTDTIDRPPHVQAAAARWQRITDLNVRLTATLDGEGRALWLALEEALHVHWLDVAVDHYHRGYAAGRAQAWLDNTLGERASPHEKLRALTAALNEIVDRLQRPPPDTAS